MPRSAARSGSASGIEAIDAEGIRELVRLWFIALDHRAADLLVGMCRPDVLIRPYRARQDTAAAEYSGHAGVREWVASLDQGTRIVLDLHEVEVTTRQSAIVEADVWVERDGERTGGLTVSVWCFEDGQLREAVGYPDWDSARAAEAVSA